MEALIKRIEDLENKINSDEFFKEIVFYVERMLSMKN
jgi:hypothetical protein